VREIVDGDARASPSARSIALSGKVEAVDKLLTFLGIGFLSALSDKYGRRPLMAWSAIGFAITNLLQATTNSVAMLYLADFADGCSSCMLPLCQAYIADVSASGQLASNLGTFQGLSLVR
jgi:DHA1 family tetracycline resistance protein-like MFS transporter